MPWSNNQRLEWGLDSFSHRYDIGWVVPKDGRYDHDDDERSRAAQRIIGIVESKIGKYPFEQLYGVNDKGDGGYVWHPSLYWQVPGKPIQNHLRLTRHLKALAAFRQSHHPGVQHISRSGVLLIEHFEGYYANPYDDGTGTWTVGYGHTGGDVWHYRHLSQRQAELLLYADLAKDYEPAVRATIRKERLTQGVMDGLTSFVFNCGVGVLHGDDDIAGKINRGDRRAACNEIMQYVQPFPAGLRPRREAECKLILAG